MSSEKSPVEEQREREIAQSRGLFVIVCIWSMAIGAAMVAAECGDAIAAITQPCDCAEVSP